MCRYLDSLSFRLDFYSTDKLIENYITSIRERLSTPSLKMVERRLSDFDTKVIDIDSVSYFLEIPLIDILNKNSYALYVQNQNYDINLVINKYFLFLMFDLKNTEIENFKSDVIDGVEKCFFHSDICQHFDIQNMTCNSNFFIEEDIDNIFKVVKKDAFPSIIELDAVQHARYADSSIEDPFLMTLVRSINKDRRNKEKVGIFINSKSYFPGLTKYDENIWSDLYDISSRQSEKCFV